MTVLKPAMFNHVTRALLVCSMATVPIHTHAQSAADVPIKQAALSPKDIKIPNWQDDAKRRRLELPMRVLPDLTAHAETTDDPCEVNLWIRNNSPNGLSEAQWGNPEDTVRLQIWNVREAILVDEHNLTYDFVDPDGNLRHRGGESIRFPWRVTPGEWMLQLTVDVTGEIRELSEFNNSASAFLHCYPSD
jgi:hypothetical protein